jgi:hypothetical protein
MEVEEEVELEEKEEEKTAMAADRHRGPRTGGLWEAGSSHPDWPGGKTVNGYSFAGDDSPVSNHPPNSECYICTSPKHMARDSAHYRRWLALKQAILIHVDLNPAEEEKEHLDYSLSQKVIGNQGYKASIWRIFFCFNSMCAIFGLNGCP